MLHPEHPLGPGLHPEHDEPEAGTNRPLLLNAKVEILRATDVLLQEGHSTSSSLE